VRRRIGERVPEGTTVALGLSRGAVVQVTASKPP
jgi:hypothetical protein